MPLPHPHPSDLICCTAPHRTALAPTKMGVMAIIIHHHKSIVARWTFICAAPARA